MFTHADIKLLRINRKLLWAYNIQVFLFDSFVEMRKNTPPPQLTLLICPSQFVPRYIAKLNQA